jgi:hypothetical protein
VLIRAGALHVTGASGVAFRLIAVILRAQAAPLMAARLARALALITGAAYLAQA